MKENFFSYLDLSICEKRLSHAFLIETDDVDKLYNDLLEFLHSKKIIKSINFENNINLLTIEPEGKEIKSSSITDLQIRFSTIPSFDEYNIYIIKESEKLNLSASNKLLKFLEEPNSKIIGFYICNINTQVLPTIKSRCQIFKHQYNNDFSIPEYIEKIGNYIKKPNYQQENEIRLLFKDMERQHVIEVIISILSLLEEELISNPPRFKETALNIQLLDKILHLLKSNVNIELVLDKLFIEVR